ncbi:MAG: hypothetical protein V1725_07655 [archaeon]
MGKFAQFVESIRLSFQRVKNDITDLNLRYNQLSLAQSETAKELKVTQEELEVLKVRIAELQSALVSRKIREAPTIVRTATPAPKKLFVGSITGGKVHVTDCPFSKNINQKNKVFFDSRIKALRKGYKECACMR